MRNGRLTEDKLKITLNLPPDTSNKLGRNCRRWGALATSRTKLLLGKMCPTVSLEQLSRVGKQTQQHLLHYGLGVTSETKFTTPAELNLYSDLETCALEMAGSLGHRLRDTLPAALMADNAPDSLTVDWTSKIGYFLLCPGAEVGCDSPVLKDTVTGAFYKAPGFVTTANMDRFTVDKNWSATEATLNDSVMEANIADYITDCQPLTPAAEPRTPVRQLARPSPKSGNMNIAAMRRQNDVSGRTRKASTGLA